VWGNGTNSGGHNTHKLKFSPEKITIIRRKKAGHGMPVSKNVAIVWQKETRISIGAARVLACSAKFDPNTSKPNMNPTAARNNEITMWWNCEASNKQSQSGTHHGEKRVGSTSTYVYPNTGATQRKKKPAGVARTLIHVHGHGMQRDSNR
jgi:hypothetical protein